MSCKTCTTNIILPQGEQGIQGPIGNTGADGADGTDGEQGIQGDTGDKGDDGDKGDKGDDGADGNVNVPAWQILSTSQLVPLFTSISTSGTTWTGDPTLQLRYVTIGTTVTMNIYGAFTDLNFASTSDYIAWSVDLSGVFTTGLVGERHSSVIYEDVSTNLSQSFGGNIVAAITIGSSGINQRITRPWTSSVQTATTQFSGQISFEIN